MVARQPAVADINVDTPDGWTVVTMGNHVSTESKAGVQTTKYKLDIPLTYWSLTAAKMQYGGAIIDGLQLGMWSPRVPVEKMVLQAELYAPILRFYSQFAPFPFKSYGALDSPAYGGGAMEAYSFATYGGGVPSEDAHEPGHTWWGGLINNTYLKSFWNESFTVFSDGLYHRNVPIGSIADRALAFSDEGTPNQLYFATPLADSGAEHGPVASALGYGKGAHVLAMLEQIIGTKAIIASFQEWLRVHPKGVPGNWEDYEKVVTAQNKSKDLKSFFDSWIRKPGAADVQLTDAAWANGSFSGKLIWKNGSFRMPLELVFSTGVTPAKRQPSYVSVLLDTKIVKADGTFSIQLATHPKQVALDPNHKAIRVGAGPTYLSATGSRSRFKVFGDAKHPEVLDYLRRSGPLTADTPLKGSLILGDPADSPIVARLCRLAGFSFGKGTTLYHRGQKIDLKHGGGLAIVNLPEGGEAMVGVGKVKLAPNLGHATTGIFDELGRFISGETRLPTNTTWIDVK